MCEGYCSGRDDAGSFADLDEYLCEYVDGTMDRTVREVFEEYVRATPALAEHIEQLRATRAVLCAYADHIHAPADLQRRLQSRLRCECEAGALGAFPLAAAAERKLRRAAAVSSLAVALLFAGLVAGRVELLEDEAAHRASVAARAEARPPGAVVLQGGFGPSFGPYAFPEAWTRAAADTTGRPNFDFVSHALGVLP